MLKQPCYFYNTTGKCRFGKHCRFVHELGIQEDLQQTTSQDEIPVKRQASVEAASSSIPSVTSSHKSQNGGINRKPEQRVSQGDVCRFYSTGRFCRFGKRCRFQHVRQQEQEKSNEQDGDDLKTSQNVEVDQVQDEEKEEGAGKKELISDGPIKDQNGRHADQKLQSKKETKPRKTQGKICKFFKEGNCRFGNKCRFLHPESEATVANGVKDLEITMGKSSTTKTDSSTKSLTEKHVRSLNVIRILKRNEVSQEKLVELHRTEINQLKRRFPADRLKIVEEGDGREAFIFTFTPTDPDWPFDVKSFDIEVEFDRDYPMKIFTLSLPVDQNLPETVRWTVEKSVVEWTAKRQRECERSGTLELLFRPFLRWLDKTIEDIVTEGLKQLRRELQAQAAGIQFVSAKDLKKDYGDPPSEKNSDEENGHTHDIEDDADLIVYRKNQNEPEEVYQVPVLSNSSDDSDDDDDDDDEDADGNKSSSDNVVHKRPQINPDTDRRGTEMIFRNFQIWYITTLLMEKLHLTVQCDRCKTSADFSTPPNRANALECGKCNNQMLVAFRATLTHSYSSTFGYLDVDGCTAFDVILQDCNFSLGCIVCNRDILVKKMTPGKVMELWCRGCHNKMKFTADSVQLRVLNTSGGVDTSLYSGNVHKVSTKKHRRAPKDPAIQEGKPLPDNGACKHYKKSYRWLRFPCCGKTYPCDICHEDKEDHEIVRANRMICGYCCREQHFAAERPCVGCGSALTKVKTTHWEGGKGCRDKLAMSRGDARKYANQNKTTSSKAQALKDKARSKKSAKLSAAKAAQK